MKSASFNTFPKSSSPGAWFGKPATAAALLVLLSYAVRGQDFQLFFDPNGNLQAQNGEIPAPPQILAPPQQQVVIPGALASFFVVAADTRGLTYQWRFFGTNLPGASADSLLLTNVSSAREGPYSVVLSNASGSVTSAPAALMIDSDGDGLPDSWEMTYFGNLNQTATGDFDNDGVSNLDEFVDGTNPASSASARFRLTVLSDGGSVSALPSRPSYTNGETVTLMATPSSPNTFHGWSGDTNTQSNPLALVMNSNKTLRALFISPPPPPGLISWWRSESNSLDAIGANHGILTNGATFATGRVGAAFSLDGINDYVLIPDSPSLRPASVTLEAWVLFNATNGFRLIMGKPAGSGILDSFALWLADGVLNGVICDTVSGGPQISYSLLPTPGRWYHVAYTFDGTSQQQSLYVNGAAVVSGTGYQAIGYDNHPVLIGADSDNGTLDGFFYGAIDEASIYNRALSPAEILSIYNANAAGKNVSAPYFTSPAQLADAVPGVGYTQQVTTVLGVLPVHYALSSGALPSELTLTTDGLISGIPGSLGSNVFEITATDAAGAATAQIFGLRVLQAAAPPGLAGWWRAETNTLDSVGTNHGTWVGSAAYSAGRVGQAFLLNGSSAYVSVADAPTLRPASVSLEAWVMFNATNGFRAIMAKTIGSGILDSYILWFDNGTLNGSVCDATGGGPTLTSTFHPVPGQWYHVAYTLDAATLQQALYLNGAVVASGTSSRGIGYDIHPMLIGGDNDNGAQAGFFSGEIDEATLYNRALGPDEIFAIYDAGIAGKKTLGPYINTATLLPDGVVGLAYAQQITSLFGLAPVTYQLSGSNATGLALSSSGLLSGVPTNSGIFALEIRATGSNGVFSDQVFSLHVYAPIPPGPGIISLWKGETNALDSIGTNHGSLTGGATFAAGKSGQSFALNGSSAYVSVPDAPSLRPASLTLEAWVMFYSSSGLQAVFSKPLGSVIGDSWQLFLNNGFLDCNVSDTPTSGTELKYGFIPVTGQWYHLAMTYDATTTMMTLYLNGVRVNFVPANRAIGYDTHPVLLGADNDNGSNVLFLNGRIDEAAVYGRALDAGEIAAIYNAGPAGRTSVGPYFTNAPALPDGYLGQPYSQTLSTVRGTAPVTCAVVAETLPGGLTLNPAGLISGTPTNTGSFSFIVRATDNAALTADQSFSIAIYSQPAPAPGIVSWWRGENNALDAIGTNNGFLTNGATFAAGKVGQGFLLDGVDDYVSIPDSPSLRPASVTLEAWVVFNGSIGPVFCKPLNPGTADSMALYLYNGALNGFIHDATENGVLTSFPFTPVPGQWYHVAFSFDDVTKEQALYLNGVRVAVSQSNRSIGYDNHPLLLGQDINNGNFDFPLNGRIDEAAIYNRALSPGEIAAIYHAGAAGKQFLNATPPPLLLAPELVGSDVKLSWTAVSNATYRLEYNPDLGPSNWSAVPGDIIGASNTASKLDALTPSNRFYRVRALP